MDIFIMKLKTKLSTTPVTPLSIVFDAIISTETDPLWKRAVLPLLLCKSAFGTECLLWWLCIYVHMLDCDLVGDKDYKKRREEEMWVSANFWNLNQRYFCHDCLNSNQSFIRLNLRKESIDHPAINQSRCSWFYSKDSTLAKTNAALRHDNSLVWR